MILEPALYVVATPIGNLGDLSPRAVDILRDVSLIAAEDTRHSKKLLNQFGIETPLVAYHDHNELGAADVLLDRIAAGASLALISDAGTPLVSDPGYRLVSGAHDRGFKVVPIPGASAAISAISVSGLASDRFCFEGFPPAKKAQRREWFEERKDERRTMVFYESTHRLASSLADMVTVFGGDRPATLARELTKLYETVKRDSLAGLEKWLAEDPQQSRGEAVVVVEGAEPDLTDIDSHAESTLLLLAEELPARKAAALAAKIHGLSKNALYRRLLEIKDRTAPI